MGTSQSSSGPGAGVLLVPPWVPDPILPASSDGKASSKSGSNVVGVDQQAQPNAHDAMSAIGRLAPARRFGPMRTSIGKFAREGSSHKMRRGLGHYIRKGLGGVTTAARRMARTSQTASDLYRILAAPRDEIPKLDSSADLKDLQARTATELMDALIEIMRPSDGTLDAEIERCALHDVFSELLTRFPDADLLDLTVEQRFFAIELFVGINVFRRFMLDLGTAIQDKSPSVLACAARIKEIKDYIKETISAQFRALLKTSNEFEPHQIRQIVSQALSETFAVFEEYA